MRVSDTDLSILSAEATFRGWPVTDFGDVDLEVDRGVTEAWWHLVGLVSEVSSMHPTWLTPELVDAVLPAGVLPVTTPGVTVGMRQYGGEYALQDLWTGEMQPLFTPAAEMEATAAGDFVQIYPASCHSTECVDHRACHLECIVDHLLRGFGVLQQQDY